jgi:hypothetical protein
VKRIVRTLPVLAALPLVVAYGLLEGFWTNRWHHSHDVERAAARLREVPLQIGDWNGEALELDVRQVARAEIEGYLMRRYVHAPTGTAVSVLLVCGRPGPVALHPPEVCYGGAGFTLVDPPTRNAFQPAASGKAATFWSATFEKAEAARPERLALYWAWNATGDWTAADEPRLQFARSPALYKLYVMRQVHDGENTAAANLGGTFLQLFLVELEKALFSRRDEG